ncbi:hypothetical protein K4F52_009140 [Lecanicillium sp. MT-2017a]|nr:hypothetical protein K4F52_009140 [Lecanicillium sp. MT-2017a]
MNECIAAAVQFSLSAPEYYQPYSHPQHSPNTYAEALRRPPPSTMPDHTYNPPPPQPPPYSHQVPLLPRPANGTTTLPPQNQLQPVQPSRATTQPTAKKKRGRPSRADRAQRELLPALPPHLMPRPSTEPRLLAPAISGVAPTGNLEIGPTAPQGTSRGKKRRRAASAETELTAEEGKTPGAASSASAPERRD